MYSIFLRKISIFPLPHTTIKKTRKSNKFPHTMKSMCRNSRNITEFEPSVYYIIFTHCTYKNFEDVLAKINNFIIFCLVIYMYIYSNKKNPIVDITKKQSQISTIFNIIYMLELITEIIHSAFIKHQNKP